MFIFQFEIIYGKNYSVVLSFSVKCFLFYYLWICYVLDFFPPNFILLLYHLLIKLSFHCKFISYLGPHQTSHSFY